MIEASPIEQTTTGSKFFFGFSNFKEGQIEIIKENNQELIDEKEKLNSGKDAIEGIARIERGMIKPGEKFFVFKSEGEEKN